MSYILDALNKSEKERARKQAPGLAALQGEQEQNSFTLKHFMLILLVLVVVNLAGLYWMFGDRLRVPEEPAIETATNIPERTAPETSELPAAEQQPAEAPELITPARRPVSNEPAPVSTDYRPLAIEDLPTAVQLRLPAIDVTTHIYASDAELRMIKIDEVARYEGDILNTDFRLLEITETGIVLEFEGYAYSIDVIEDWLDP